MFPEYLVFTIDWKNQRFTHHVGINKAAIKHYQSDKSLDLLVIGGAHMMIIQDPQNILNLPDGETPDDPKPARLDPAGKVPDGAPGHVHSTLHVPSGQVDMGYCPACGKQYTMANWNCVNCEGAKV